MGTHGRKGLDRIVFRSVAEQIVKSSNGAVFLVNSLKIAQYERRIDYRPDNMRLFNSNLFKDFYTIEDLPTSLDHG